MLFAVAVAASCASGTTGGARSRSSAAPTTEYYYGTMTTSSPDGKVPFGPPVMTLVRREVAPADDRIVETVVQDGVTRVTTLQRQEGNHFAASADDRSISGALDFAGDDWRWASWTYAITMNDGSGTIQGTGHVDGKWIETEKYVVASNGDRRARIVDRLVQITHEEYERRLGEMKATKRR
jgi:hypothetical protein